MANAVSFQLRHTDADTSARLGTVRTLRGEFETPAFMPVGTLGTVKGLTSTMVRDTGAQIVLANTYHLALRPGEDIVAKLGGLHRFMDWPCPILTDSGGFQIFSLAKLTRIDDRGAKFQSHLDGAQLDLTPERAMQIQQTLGSDIAMVLDHVVRLPARPEEIGDACQRTVQWAKRCRDVSRDERQATFAIVQGGLDAELRQRCAEQLVKLDFPGYAIGGLSVGETHEEMNAALDATCPSLPKDRPRYLMGVGRPEDLLAGIRRGVDMFDCVMPTRNGRNALAFTDDGPLRLRNLQYQTSQEPLDESTHSAASPYSRGYIRHLFMAKEMLGPILVSCHNLAYYQRLMREARAAIAANRFDEFEAEKRRGWMAAPVE